MDDGDQRTTGAGFVLQESKRGDGVAPRQRDWIRGPHELCHELYQRVCHNAFTFGLMAACVEPSSHCHLRGRCCPIAQLSPSPTAVRFPAAPAFVAQAVLLGQVSQLVDGAHLPQHCPHVGLLRELAGVEGVDGGHTQQRAE